MKKFLKSFFKTHKLKKTINIHILKGAFWSLVVGMLTGLIRMILDFIYFEPPCGQEDKRPAFLKKVILLDSYF